MDDRRWTMDDGRWTMDDGRWVGFDVKRTSVILNGVLEYWSDGVMED